MISNDKEFRFDKLDEAYHKMEDCFDPLSAAVVSLKAAGLDALSHQVQSALNILQEAQDVVREARRDTRGDKSETSPEKQVILDNPKHLKCTHCGHEENIYAATALPEGEGKYTLYFGSEADFCTKCDAPWGRNLEGSHETSPEN